jgi:DNA topoisomerase-1
MKFSTLTKDDLIEAYENKSKTLDWGQAHAGETRHMLDWFYGINTSRALTLAIKTTGMFKIMSTGRVQGPALKLIVDKEKEIQAFKPEPYWQIELDGEAEKKPIIAWHIEDKFWEKEKAEKIYNKIKAEKKAKVAKVEKKLFNQSPPFPFDLTSMQIEAYRTLRISPKITLSIAQDLYTSGYISYPRTSSQQLPAKIGYKKIITALSRNPRYYNETKILLSKASLKPNEGKKTDPAHPAIYPTGIQPKNLKKEQADIYELIVRRFLATFGDPAVRQTMNVKINCKEEPFLAKGTTTAEPGWHLLYGRFVMLKEEELPIVKESQIIDVRKIKFHSKETQPPKRYTEASIIKELEHRGLGTKSTRSEIIDTLFKRDYISGKQVQATDLGIKTIETLEKHNPEIIDEALTRHFEEEMEEIREGKKKEEAVIDEAKGVLVKIMDKFKKSEKEIGKKLSAAQKETRKEMTTLGKCPVCKEGDLIIRRGKFGQFAACSRYPDCKTTFSLPSNALVKPTKKACSECNFPMVQVIRKGKRPQELCLNPECPLKKVAEEKIKKKCPKCGKDMVVRSSVYGKFLACSGYPKCKHIERL